MNVYVVTMRRWGDCETHNYVLGVYSNYADAVHYGDVEKIWRAGKYEPHIVYKTLDEPLAEEQIQNYKECTLC